MTNKLPTIKIKGSEYTLVKERLQYLANQDQPYSLESDYQYYPERKLWVVKSILTWKGCAYVGLAQEVESDDYRQVNSTSALENCQTSAIGRACAMAGIGLVDSSYGIASADEVQKAISRTPKSELRPCDKDGGRFVLRKGSGGDFYGCDNWPTCKRTLDMESAEQWKLNN